MSAPKKRRRRKKKLKPVFEGRNKAPADPTIPEGFDVNLGALSQEEAYAEIKARLEVAKQNLPDEYTGRVLMHAMADGSVDGELYVLVPEDDYQGNVNWDMQQAFGDDSLGSRYWISMGSRFSLKEDDEIYRRVRGLNHVQTNYQRAYSTNIAEEGLILRKKLLPGMKKRYKREAHSIFIRLHWNPENKQPKR